MPWATARTPTAFAQVYGLERRAQLRKAGATSCSSPARAPSRPRRSRRRPEQLEARLAPLRARLLAARDKRPAPLRDDKVLTSWNGLMIAAYADGYPRAQGRDVPPGRREGRRLPAREAANPRRPPAADLSRGQRQAPRLPRRLRLPRPRPAPASTPPPATPAGCARPSRSTDRMIADFADKEDGGFFFTAERPRELLARPKDPFDNALPSGNSVAVLDLIELYRITRQTSYLDRAGKAWLRPRQCDRADPGALPLTLVGLGQYLDERPDAATEKLAAGRDHGRTGRRDRDGDDSRQLRSATAARCPAASST